MFKRFIKKKMEQGLDFWCRPEHMGYFENPKVINAIKQSKKPDQLKVDILKRGRRRSIFRIDLELGSFIIKAFPLEKYYDKIRYKKYGFSEARNILRSNEIGIPTPLCYGYFERKSGLLIDNCGIIIGYLSGYTQLDSIVKVEPGKIYLALPAFVQMYRFGVNHIDASLYNIFIADRDSRYSLIDWQYCTFTKPFNEIQLIVQASHFLKTSKIQIESPIWCGWIEKMYEAVSPKISKEDFFSHIKLLQPQKISINNRLALNANKLGIKL